MVRRWVAASAIFAMAIVACSAADLGGWTAPPVSDGTLREVPPLEPPSSSSSLETLAAFEGIYEDGVLRFEPVENVGLVPLALSTVPTKDAGAATGYISISNGAVSQSTFLFSGTVTLTSHLVGKTIGNLHVQVVSMTPASGVYGYNSAVARPWLGLGNTWGLWDYGVLGPEGSQAAMTTATRTWTFYSTNGLPFRFYAYIKGSLFDATGMQFWGRADTTAGDGRVGALFADQTPSHAAVNLTAVGSPPTVPNAAAGYKPAIRFDGGQYMSNTATGFGTSVDNTVFIVAALRRAAISSEGLLSFGTGAGVETASMSFGLTGNTSGNFATLLALGAKGGTFDVKGNTDYWNDFHVLTYSYDATGASLRVDGVASGSATLPTPSSAVDLARLVLGARANLTASAPVDIAEVMTFNTAVTGAQRTDIEAYLKDKYPPMNSGAPDGEPNDTCATAISIPSLPATINGSVASGNPDYYRFTLAQKSDVWILASDPSVSPPVGTDPTTLGFYSAAACSGGSGDMTGGVGNFGQLDPGRFPVLRQVPAGTYTMHVSSSAAAHPYVLSIRTTSTCGNGVVEGFEVCDGQVGCSATCTLAAATCGDGVRTHGELCDDGNTASGDACAANCLAAGTGYVCTGLLGCTAVCGGTVNPPEACDDNVTPVAGDGCDQTCVPEVRFPAPLADGGVSFVDVEPNNTIAQADLRATDATPVLINAQSTYVRGTLTSGDMDMYKMVLTTGATVRFILVAGPLVELRDGIGQVIDSGSSSSGSSSEYVRALTAGTYYFRIGGGASTYAFQVKRLTDLGTEIEPNDANFTNVGDSSYTATTLPGSPTKVVGNDVVIFGRHQEWDMDDWYLVNVPAGKQLVAETLEGGNEACETAQLDTVVGIYTATGPPLAFNDDFRGYCSRVSYVAPTTQAYYVRVTKYFGWSGNLTQNVFDYRLAITVR